MIRIFKIGPTCTLQTNKAFSLIELLVAIVLIALFSSLVLPSLSHSLDKYQFKNFCQKLTALGEEAQRRSIRTQKTHRLLFNFKTGTVTLLQKNGLSFSPVSDLSPDLLIPNALSPAAPSQNFIFDCSATLKPFRVSWKGYYGKRPVVLHLYTAPFKAEGNFLS